MSHLKLPQLLTLLINLDRSERRRTQMENRLAQINLPYTRIAAVDGHEKWPDLKASVNISQFEKNVGRTLMPGEIGCYHSHLKAWNYFLSQKQEILLVLEDDVVFGNDFIQAVNLAITNKAKWDIIHLNKIRANQPIKLHNFGTHSFNTYFGAFTGMGAYLISRNAIQRLLPKMLPITLPIDLELDKIHTHRLRRYGIEPFPSVVSDENESTISGNKFSNVNKHPWHQRFPAYRRRLKNLFLKQMYLLRTRQIFPQYRRDND